MRHKITSVFLLMMFFSFIICKDAVIEGAKEGLLLWYRTLLPTLLPVMILTKIMIQNNSFSFISRLIGPAFRIFPGVSENASFAVISGLFCGYPTGAKITADLLKAGKITTEEGNYILSFCNNISPMFLSAYFLPTYIPEKRLHLPIFIILFTTPLLCSQLFRIADHRIFCRRILSNSHAEKKCPLDIIKTHPSSHIQNRSLNRQAAQKTVTPSLTVEDCMMDSFESIVLVGLYVMIFSIFIRFKSIVPLPDDFIKIFFFSILEITNGLAIANTVFLPRIPLYVYFVFLTSFGGICAVFQTASMIRNTDLSVVSYITKKLIIATITSFLCYVYLLMN